MAQDRGKGCEDVPQEIQDRALNHAAGVGDHKKVKRLLNIGANPNWANPKAVSEPRQS